MRVQAKRAGYWQLASIFGQLKTVYLLILLTIRSFMPIFGHQCTNSFRDLTLTHHFIALSDGDDQIWR